MRLAACPDLAPRSNAAGEPRHSPSPRALLVGLVAAALATATSCTDPSRALCEAVCDCAECTETELEMCVVGLSHEADWAEMFGCKGELEPLRDCYLDTHTCEDGVVVFEPSDECLGEEAGYEACMSGVQRDSWGFSDLPGAAGPVLACRQAERRVSEALEACNVDTGTITYGCDDFFDACDEWGDYFACAASAVVCNGTTPDDIDYSGLTECSIPPECSSSSTTEP